MRVMPTKEFRRRLGQILRDGEQILVLRRGIPAFIVLPATSEVGKKLIASREAILYTAFVGEGSSGETGISEEHDIHLYG